MTTEQTSTTTQTTAALAAFHAFWSENDLQLVDFFRRLESRAIPCITTTDCDLISADDVTEATAIAASCGVTLDFVALPASLWSDELEGQLTRDIIALVERACDGTFTFTADEAGEDAGVWCLSGVTRHVDTRGEGLGWETEDQPAESRREAAVDALNYLMTLSDHISPDDDPPAAPTDVYVTPYLVLNAPDEGGVDCDNCGSVILLGMPSDWARIEREGPGFGAEYITCGHCGRKHWAGEQDGRFVREPAEA